MVEKVSSSSVSGVDIRDECVRAALLTVKRGKPALEALTMTEGAQLQKQLVVTAVATEVCLVRPLHLSLSKDKDIDAVIAFQAEPLLPYPVDEAIIDWVKLKQDREGSDITVIAAKKEHVAAHIAACEKEGFEPEVVAAVPSALAAFSAFFVEAHTPHFVVDIGDKRSTCALVHQGKLIAAQECLVGYSSDEAGWELLCREVMKVLFSLAKQAYSDDLSELLITGVGGADSALVDKLCRMWEGELLLYRSRTHFPDQAEELAPYAVAIGLALTVLPLAAEQVNFRQGALIYPHPWKRLKKPLALYFVAVLALAWAASLFGHAYLGYRYDQLKERYGDLLAQLHKPYEQFESEYQRKYPEARSGSDGEVLSLKELTLPELYSRLELLDKEVKGLPDPIALYPNVPRVSDVLAWLSTHPNVTLAGESGSRTDAPIQIESFAYTMVERPEEKKKQSRYRVKVEIEFSSPTPKLAREFHDSLIVPNPIVDPKGEVKWSSSRGKYRTAFMLRDKTAYPSQYQQQRES